MEPIMNYETTFGISQLCIMNYELCIINYICQLKPEQQW